MGDASIEKVYVLLALLFDVGVAQVDHQVTQTLRFAQNRLLVAPRSLQLVGIPLLGDYVWSDGQKEARGKACEEMFHLPLSPLRLFVRV